MQGYIPTANLKEETFDIQYKDELESIQISFKSSNTTLKFYFSPCSDFFLYIILTKVTKNCHDTNNSANG